MTEYRIVRANILHLVGIDRIEKACFPIPWSTDLLLNSILSDEYSTFVAVSGKKVIGFGIMMKNYDEAHIMNVAVDSGYRRAGVGSAVMEALIDESRRWGIYDITLEVRASNAGAIALYEKYGFRTEGVRREYYSDNHEDALIMWLHLDKGEHNEDNC